MSATDLTTLAAQIEERLTEDETTAKAAQLRFPGPWDRATVPDSPLPSAVSLYDSRDESLAVIRGSYAADHIARNDPARVLRRVKATRELVAAILAEPHDWNPGDEFYSCSQAIDPYGLNHDGREPGSACTDPDRAGKPCDCGRDQRVARLLGIIASEWET